MHARDVGRPPARRAALPRRRSRSCGRTRSACSTKTCAPRSSSRVAGGSVRARRRVAGVERGAHTDELRELWEEMTIVRRSVAGGARGDGRPQVWEALAEIPDPEIPVISLVDLGVVRDVARRRRPRARRVHADVPRLPGARGDARRDGRQDRATLGGEPEVEVVLDDSWSTDRITAEGREKLRAAGFAPPAPREARPPTARPAQRRPSAARTAARPTRSSRTSSARRRAARIRYCARCRQPFEQFKTI